MIFNYTLEEETAVMQEIEELGLTIISIVSHGDFTYTCTCK